MYTYTHTHTHTHTHTYNIALSIHVEFNVNMSPGQDRDAALQISANLSLSAINTHLKQWGLSSASAIVREARVIGPPTKCAAGFEGPHGVPCVLCDAGKYKEENGTGLCIPCVAGKYAESSGNTNRSACERCMAGKFSPTLGSKNASSCLDCPTTTYSGEGSNMIKNCSCNRGYTGEDGAECSECIAGTWKAVNGSSSCILCASGKYSTEPAKISETTCVDCPAQSYSGGGSNMMTNCTCNKGYSGPDGSICQACVAGTWKAVNGSSSCILCASGKYSSEMGVISEATCVDCPAQSYSGGGSNMNTNCTCDKGYSGPDGSNCQACVSGTWKAVNGSSSCILCASGKYSNETGEIAESTCDDCPAHTYSGDGSKQLTNCVCNLGYSGPNGKVCTGCEAGHFKPANGSAACTPCASATYMTGTAATACDVCPGNSSSSVASSSLLDCTCNLGFTGPNGSTCIECEAGFSKSVSGPSECVICPRGSYAGAAKSACTLCAANTYVNMQGATICRSCPPQTKSGPGSSNQTHCTPDVVGLQSVYSVASNLSTFLANLDTYLLGLAQVAGADITSVHVLSLTQVFTDVESVTGLNNSDGNATTNPTANLTANVSANSSSARRLLASSSSSGRDTSAVEAKTRVSVPRYFREKAREGLLEFPTWVSARGLPAATLKSGLIFENCGAGYEPRDNYTAAFDSWNMSYGPLGFPYTANGSNHSRPERCVLCATGKYKNSSDDSMCVACSQNSLSPFPGAILLSQCACVPSYYSNAPLSFNYSCHVCGEGVYCPGGQERIPCAPGTYTIHGVVNYSSSCTLCQPMTYKNNWGGGNCSNCPDRMESGLGAAVCSCMAGFIGPAGGPCLCKNSSARFLEVAVNSTFLDNAKTVTLRVYNISTGFRLLCGQRQVYCEPFVVHYTLDGTQPTQRSPIACDGWRADLCAAAWGNGYVLAVRGGNLLRAVVLKQGYHEDICLEYWQNVTSFPADFAARECNTPIQETNNLVNAYPDPLLVTITVLSPPSNIHTNCSCSAAACCAHELSPGPLRVRFADVRDDSSEILYHFCQAPLPMDVHNGSACTPGGNMTEWPVYASALVFTTRSYVSVVARYNSSYGPSLYSEVFTFQVPVMNLVELLPSDYNLEGVGESAGTVCCSAVQCVAV